MSPRAKRPHRKHVSTALNNPRNTAVHEAGHAVIARVLTLKCGGASIRADYKTETAGYAIIHDPLECDGEWRYRFKRRDTEAAERARIIVCMAGIEAEIELLGAAEGGDGEDLHHIDLLAEQLNRCDLNRLRRMTRMLVRRHRERIERVADALLAKKRLTEKQIDRLAGRSLADVPNLRPSYMWTRKEKA